MKNFHISSNINTFLDSIEVKIINDDTEPSLKQIEFRYNNGHIHLQLNYDRGWTQELGNEFRKKHNSYSDLENYEFARFKLNDKESIIEFLRLVQSTDPLPLSAYEQLGNVDDKFKQIDFELLFYETLIHELVDEGEHQLALEKALAISIKGQFEALVFLSDLYIENQDKENYFNTLEHFPSDHPYFKDANEKIFESLMTDSEMTDSKMTDSKMTDTDNNPIQGYELLTKKFRCALNTQDNLADHLFDELSGNNGLHPKIKNLKGDPDTLIKVAEQLRELRQENQELRAFKTSQLKRKTSLEKPNPQNISGLESFGLLGSSKRVGSDNESDNGSSSQNRLTKR